MADAGHTNAESGADGPPLILVDDRQEESLDVDGLVALAHECLVGEGVADAELSVSFVTEDEMADLHVRYLGEEGPTDVLSFPLGDEDPETGHRVIGDVVIAPAVAKRNNPGDRDGELRLLLVHGILHLLGHDHMNDADHAEMWARQERYTGVQAS
jgi:probable rRNA maturation factor